MEAGHKIQAFMAVFGKIGWVGAIAPLKKRFPEERAQLPWEPLSPGAKISSWILWASSELLAFSL